MWIHARKLPKASCRGSCEVRASAVDVEGLTAVGSRVGTGGVLPGGISLGPAARFRFRTTRARQLMCNGAKLNTEQHSVRCKAER